MNHIALWMLIFITLSGISSCVQVRPATLYDGYIERPAPARPDKISRVVEPIIFFDDKRDVWGIEKDVCKEVVLSTDIVYAGRSALKLTWDRNAPGCTWAGIGIGWDGYAGKDLTAIMDYAAISFYVRTVQGRAFGLPFVLTFEDYSGGMGFCYTANKYFERTVIDESWQNVRVPLADFDLETERLDVTNIKQLQIELQQSGAFYIDHIELIFYTPEPQEPWMVEAPRPDPLKLPVYLFDDAFINNHGWGMVSDHCQDFSISGSESYAGNTSIHTQWNHTSTDCHLLQFGVSWNHWFPTDIRPIVQSGQIEFQMKLISLDSEGELGMVRVGFEDYDRISATVPVLAFQSLKAADLGKWRKYTVSISDLPTGVDLSRIKHLYFEFSGRGEAYIDQIAISSVNY